MSEAKRSLLLEVKQDEVKKDHHVALLLVMTIENVIASEVKKSVAIQTFDITII